MTNEILLDQLKQAVSRERELTALVLGYLKQVEDRKIYLEEGYSSLFKFCIEYLGYSEPEALVRLRAMRLMRAFPGTGQKIESGELSLSVAAKAQGVFGKNSVPKEKQAVVLAELTGATTRVAEKILAREFPQEIPPEKTRVLTETHTEIRFTVGPAAMEKFNRLKELLAHKNFSGRYDLLFEELADIVLKKLEPKPSIKPAGADKNTRYIPAATRHQILARESCEYVSPSGKRCGSRHGVQMDHRINFSEGGTNAPENLQLLCGAHNRWKYRTGR